MFPYDEISSSSHAGKQLYIMLLSDWIKIGLGVDNVLPSEQDTTDFCSCQAATQETVGLL